MGGGGTYWIVTLSNGLIKDCFPNVDDDFFELIEWVESYAPMKLIHKDELIAS